MPTQFDVDTETLVTVDFNSKRGLFYTAKDGWKFLKI